MAFIGQASGKDEHLLWRCIETGVVEYHAPIRPQHRLAYHELVTNAVKYGALSNHDGTLEVRWSVAGGVLKLDWQERDGPQIDAPERNGFGYVLVEGQIEQQLGGKLDANFHKDGLVLKMEFPL